MPRGLAQQHGVPTACRACRRTQGPVEAALARTRAKAACRAAHRHPSSLRGKALEELAATDPTKIFYHYRGRRAQLPGSITPAALRRHFATLLAPPASPQARLQRSPTRWACPWPAAARSCSSSYSKNSGPRRWGASPRPPAARPRSSWRRHGCRQSPRPRPPPARRRHPPPPTGEGRPAAASLQPT